MALRLDQFTHGIVADVLHKEFTDAIHVGRVTVDGSVAELCHDLAAVVVASLMW